MNSLFFLLICTLLLMGFITFYKIRRVHLMLFGLKSQIEQSSDAIFTQIEALLALYRDFSFEQSLPPTRGWAASPDFLYFLATHMKAYKPTTVLECSSGVSTLVLAHCARLNGNGHIYSLEHDPNYAELTRTRLLERGLSSWATVIEAPLSKHQLEDQSYLWYSLEKIPKIDVDMLVIDGPPSTVGPIARYPALPLLRDHFQPITVVFLDDAARPDEKKAISLWKSQFPNLKIDELPAEKGLSRITLWSRAENLN